MKIWLVEFNFLEDGRCMNIKYGFDSQADAEEWAQENTDDGRVSYMTRTSF